MKAYFLGYRTSECDELTEFENAKDASFNSEEWIEVHANSLEEAKSRYEEEFEKWKERSKIDLLGEEIIIGEITHVERSQSDYDEMYGMYNVGDKDLNNDEPRFSIIHEIHERRIYTSETVVNDIEDEGLSYLIPSAFDGIVIYDLENNIK